MVRVMKVEEAVGAAYEKNKLPLLKKVIVTFGEVRL